MFAQRLSRDLHADLLINQVAYVPEAGKICVARGKLNGNFEAKHRNSRSGLQRKLRSRGLDWIIGVNPFNSSTIEGVGYNQPKHFPGSSFNPLTPVLSGAVPKGLGGDHRDQTMIGKGDWQISEYWTPMVAYTISHG